MICCTRKSSKRKQESNKDFSLISKYKIIVGFCVVVSALFLVTLSWTYSEVLFPQEYVGNLVVGVIVARESSYIEEWLAHHFYYGVDKIVIFDDNKPEEAEEKAAMRRICASFGDRCEITDFNAYDDVACILTSSFLCATWLMPTTEGTSHSVLAPTRRQGMAMKEFYYYNDNYKKYRWVMMFDVDEFMVTRDVSTKITDVLRHIPADVQGVHVPRYTFGTDNHTTRPPGAVRLNYCWREKHVKNSKGMARPGQVWLPGLTNHFYTTRSMASYQGLTQLPKFVRIDNMAQQPGSALLELPGGVRGVTKFSHFYIDPSALVLNHYLTKSVEEHTERRSRASLNYLFKLKDVYKDDKTATAKYNRYQCDIQKLSQLPPLMTAQDLREAERRRGHSNNNNNTATVTATVPPPPAPPAPASGGGAARSHLRRH